MGYLLNKKFWGGVPKKSLLLLSCLQKELSSSSKEFSTMILKQMSLLWYLALALQPTTYAQGCSSPFRKFAKAETLIKYHALKFSKVHVFCSFFFVISSSQLIHNQEKVRTCSWRIKLNRSRYYKFNHNHRLKT